MDFSVATLRNKAASLPEIAELLATTQRLAVVRDLEVAAKTQISDSKKELLRSETDVEQVSHRLERDERRLADGTAAPKELEKIQHEVETLTVRRSEFEDVELEIMIRIDSIKTRLDELEQEEERLAEQASQIEFRKNNSSSELENEIASIISERKATAESVDSALFDLYEKVRSKSGTGAAALREGRGDGWHLAINSVELGRIKTWASDGVVRRGE